MNEQHSTGSADERLAYGARCSWFGPIQEVGTRGASKLPCCPHCGNMLFEMPTHAEWWSGVDSYERQQHPGYRVMLEWQRDQKKCFSGIHGLAAAYAEATGIRVPL